MTLTQIPTRMLVLLGVALAAAAALLVVRPLVLDDDSGTTAATPAVTTPPARAATPTKPAKPAATKPAVTKVTLLPGLPTPLARKLRFSRVVVASLYAGTAAGDRPMVGQARAGAREAGAGFVAMNVLRESTARELQPFVGTVSAPVLLVVKRPGRVVTRIDGPVDSAVVAQAARNAGAHR